MIDEYTVTTGRGRSPESASAGLWPADATVVYCGVVEEWGDTIVYRYLVERHPHPPTPTGETPTCPTPSESAPPPP